MLTTVTITPEEVKTRLDALGVSQNALARGIRKDSGHVSRVLRRLDISAVILRRAARWLDREELKRGIVSTKEALRRGGPTDPHPETAREDAGAPRGSRDANGSRARRPAHSQGA